MCLPGIVKTNKASSQSEVNSKEDYFMPRGCAFSGAANFHGFFLLMDSIHGPLPAITVVILSVWLIFLPQNEHSIQEQLHKYIWLNKQINISSCVSHTFSHTHTQHALSPGSRPSTQVHYINKCISQSLTQTQLFQMPLLIFLTKCAISWNSQMLFLCHSYYTYDSPPSLMAPIPWQAFKVRHWFISHTVAITQNLIIKKLNK